MTLRGAVVLKVAPDSPMATYVKPMDVIYSVNGHPVTTAEEAVRALNGHADADPLVLGLDRVVKGAIERRTVRVP